MMRFWFGFFVGALGMALFAYRKQISDIINNRKAISAGGKVASGISDVVEGAKDLFGEID
jgi:hypothetical protein